MTPAIAASPSGMPARAIQHAGQGHMPHAESPGERALQVALLRISAFGEMLQGLLASV